ncbi:MAG: Asp/Glu racemase [Gammaproteobacteria bacterium]|nr:Asp/Glu racemase [Gammaproteobacteria bacterium]
MSRHYRVGQIVPSSNVTMETEIPAVFRDRERHYDERFTFHSSRMRMKTVTKEELALMDRDSDRCAVELSDAAMDVIGYACLVAIMSVGLGYHRESQARLRQVTVDNGHPCSVISSAGALVEGLSILNAKRIALITPYRKPLTNLVCQYLESEGFEVLDAISLEIPDNLEVARQDPMAPVDLADRLNLANVDTLIASACVQMPSLPAVSALQAKTGIPTLSASVATSYRMLKELDLDTHMPGFGALFE